VNLEKTIVHETHEVDYAGNPHSGYSQKTRTNSIVCHDWLCHLTSELLNLCNILIYLITFALRQNTFLQNFVTFMLFVDKKGFKNE
jgi:hypothetical protein